MIFSFLVALSLVTYTSGAAYDFLYARAISGGGTSDTYGYTASMLPTGGVVVGGITNGNLATPLSSGTITGQNGFVRSYDASGGLSWAKQLSSGSYASVTGSATDSSGNVYVTLMCAASWYGGTMPGYYSVCFSKYDSSGTQLLTAQDGGDGVDYAQSIATNTDGSFFIAGYTTSPNWGGARIGTHDGFILKFNSIAVKQGFYRIGVAGYAVIFFSAAIDSAGNVWATGFTNAPTFQGATSAGGKQSMILKMSASGVVAFGRLAGGVSDDQANCIALDGSNSAYITGFTLSGFDGKTLAGAMGIQVVKFDQDGVWQWSQIHGGTGSRNEGKGVAFDTANNVVYVTGTTNSANFHGAANSVTADYGSFFLLVLSPATGSVLSAFIYSGASPAMGYAIATNGANVYLAGLSHGGTTYSGQAVSGRQGSLVLKLTGPGAAATTSPSVAPTAAPTIKPTAAPSTAAPTVKPTALPTANPSFLPTVIPTRTPSTSPTAQPTENPTATPSADPSAVPSAAPTATPSADPSAVPSAAPTATPSADPSAVPSAAPTVEPTTVPSLHPTADPTVDPTVAPSAAPTPLCLQWTQGELGESCTATCSSVARGCSANYYSTVVTQTTFYAMVQSAVNVRTGELLGSTGEYCAAGLNALPAAGVPSARSVLLSQDGVFSVANLCSYPTSVADTAALDCDATLTASAGRRFCPCISEGCDGSWRLSDSGESCDETCGAAGKECDAEPLEFINSNADFLRVVASSTNSDGSAVADGLAENYCTEGINTYEFADAPASVTIVAPGAANKTFCTYPTPAAPSSVACDVSYPFVRRFCRCSASSAPPATRKLRTSAAEMYAGPAITGAHMSAAAGVFPWWLAAVAAVLACSAALLFVAVPLRRKEGNSMSAV